MRLKSNPSTLLYFRKLSNLLDLTNIAGAKTNIVVTKNNAIFKGDLLYAITCKNPENSASIMPNRIRSASSVFLIMLPPV